MNKEPMREHSVDGVGRVHELETRAAAARERLIHAVEALDARRRQMVRIGTQAKQLAVPAILSVAAVGALFGASLLFFGLAVRRQRRRSLTHRFRAALPRPERRPSFWRILAEKGVASLAGIVATQIGRKVSKNVLDGRYPNGRPALPVPRHRTLLHVG